MPIPTITPQCHPWPRPKKIQLVGSQRNRAIGSKLRNQPARCFAFARKCIFQICVCACALTQVNRQTAGQPFPSMWALRRIGVVRLEKQNGLPISNHKENGVWMWHEGCLPQGGVIWEQKCGKSWGGRPASPNYFLFVSSGSGVTHSASLWSTQW